MPANQFRHQSMGNAKTFKWALYYIPDGLFNCCFLNKIPEAEKTNVGILILKEIFGLFTLAVLENRDERIGASIVKAIKKHARKFDTSVLLSCADEYEYFHGVGADLLIISPGAKPDTRRTLRAKCILMPGDLLNSFKAVESDYVISYGMSPRDTITASSISDDGVQISLQRELVTLKGEVVERQELPLVPSNALLPRELCPFAELPCWTAPGIANPNVGTNTPPGKLAIIRLTSMNILHETTKDLHEEVIEVDVG